MKAAEKASREFIHHPSGVPDSPLVKARPEWKPALFIPLNPLRRSSTSTP
jgi:hypothetical protein